MIAKIKNKKAGERVLGFYWMIVFVIITIGIVSAAAIFYGNLLDVRQIETRILSDRLIDCISENGKLNTALIGELQGDGSNLESKCGLIFSDSSYTENQFYVNITIEGGKSIIFDKDKSGKFINFCNDDSKKVPTCHSETVFLLSGNNLQKVEVLVSISKISQNVKV